MDRIRLDDVPGRIVAWHNRHPLAQRIGAAHVRDVGAVVLPFVADAKALAAAPLPELVPGRGLAAWLARRLQQRRRSLLAPAFSERFIDALAPARAARWARRHASLWSVLPADWPRRTIAADTRLTTREAATGKMQTIELHLLSAVVDAGDRQRRVLLGAGGKVLGVRAFARLRVAAAAAIACVVITPLVALVGLPRSSAAPASTAAKASPAAASAAVAPPASAATAANGAASHTVATATVAHPEPAPSAPASGTAQPPEPSTAAAADAQPRQAPARSILPPLSDEEKRVAIETGQRLREAARHRPVPASAPAASVAVALRATPDHPVYALVAPPTRQRDEAIALLARAQALQAMNVAPARRDVFAANGMWRAAFWPFESLADAERARIVLAGKGLRAEVVEF